MKLRETGNWEILETGKASARKIMALDASLLEEIGKREKPLLHLYDWEGDSATFGYFIDPHKLLTPEAMEGKILHLARRPTGGGVIFHVADWAFSLIVPASHPGYSINTLENYAYVNHLVIEVIERFTDKKAVLSLLPAEPVAKIPDSRHFCMAKPTKFDVMLEGRKVGGGAQRRTRTGFLHQGTISLALPEPEFLQRVLLPGTGVEEEMRRNTCSLIGEQSTHRLIVEARKELSRQFRSVIFELA